MNLVVLAGDVDSVALKNVAKLTETREIEQITTRSFRLVGAKPHEALVATCAEGGLDHVWLPEGRQLRDFGLFVTDMDSTLINIECIDEIADMQGLKREVAAITEAAMQGEIDFRESLTRRVALLAGLPESALAEVFDHRLQLNPGAQTLVQACKAAGLKVLLVSGGFTFFSERVRQTLGIDFTRANVLEVESGPNCGQLTGRMVDQPWGDICDGAEKRRTLLEVASLLDIAPSECIAMGDGANDLPMMGVAGLSVAYHAKPTVRAQAMVAINEGGLDRLLEVLR